MPDQSHLGIDWFPHYRHQMREHRIVKPSEHHPLSISRHQSQTRLLLQETHLVFLAPFHLLLMNLRCTSTCTHSRWSFTSPCGLFLAFKESLWWRHCLTRRWQSIFACECGEKFGTKLWKKPGFFDCGTLASNAGCAASFPPLLFYWPAKQFSAHYF